MAQLSRARLYGLLLLACGGLAAYHSWAHDGRGASIAETAIWSQCCGQGDCFPQRLQIIGNEAGKKLSVQIEGVETSVDKDKFSPVPSDRTWVCYARPGGTISNENIRCILYPQQSGTT